MYESAYSRLCERTLHSLPLVSVYCQTERRLLLIPTSDIAVKFADYVLENYIYVDSKFPTTLWAQPPDVSGLAFSGPAFSVALWGNPS